MKKVLLFLFIHIVHPIDTKAQQRNEIKIDFLALLEPMAQVSYEHIWVKTRFAIETTLNYNWQDSDVMLTLGQLPADSKFEMKTIGIQLGARYYFQHNADDRRFFGSIFYFNEFKMDSDEEYLKYYRAVYGEPVFDPKWRRSVVGILAGHKWLLKEQLVVEPLLGIGYNLLPIFDHRRRSDASAFINLNVGYRF
ncbi:MAG: hypothetical protein OHK0019_06930 [Saprospiraceae bacterium]